MTSAALPRQHPQAHHLQALSALAMGVRCRPVQASDMGFLREAYARARAQDLALLAVDAATLDALLQMQFDAQRRHYSQAYPGCTAWVIERGQLCQPGVQPVGQMWLHLDEQGLRLMDISVLPSHRLQGIAAICVQALLHIADAMRWPVHLHVLADNPIRHWYARLGFVTTGHTGLHQAMTRPAVDQENRYEQA